MFCHNCGTELEEDAVFCWNCGKAQTPVQPEQTAVSEEISVQPEQVVQSDETTVQFEQPAQFEETPVQPKQISEPEKEVKNEPKKEEKMVYCTRCGRTMPESSDECPNCQKSVSMNDDPSRRVVLGPWVVSKTAHKMIKERDNKIKWFAHGAMILCLVLALKPVLFKPSVKVTPYAKITYSGYNGYATSNVAYDYDSFDNRYSFKFDAYEKHKNFPMSKAGNLLGMLDFLDLDYYGGGASPSDVLSNCSGELDNKERLKNGDVITYNWKINDDYILERFGFYVKSKPVKVKVEGLAEPPELDLFEGLELICDGEDGQGEVELSYKLSDKGYIEGPEIEWNNKAVYDIRYVVDKYENLSNEDIITVSIVDYEGNDPTDMLVLGYGFKPTAVEKKFLVDGLTPVEGDETGNEE